ncbi:DUF2142 domain-containing protein [Cellulomonas triticagri]|uniref:DUF2142 domain-containing protein n=1 Tax=Cellulomonas triticagri TaxID=2483352 RepID=A0A3M2JRF9_9CELL|nr:DUF2142 domain-containing protein [Cellulomonas triticagri]RMI13285.1 DUF2142 domain-containing protein [Cellulomonas triticagri]
MSTTGEDSVVASAARDGGAVGSTRRVRPRAPRWIPAVLCVVVVLLGVVLAATARVGAQQGDVTQHFGLTNADTQLRPGASFDMELTATEDDLSEVAVVLGTWSGRADCTLTATLRDGGREIASQDTPCAELPDTALATVISFDPIADSAGTTYDVTLSVSEDSRRGPALWDTVDGQHPVVALYGEPDRPMLSVVGDVLDRIAVYGPAWGSPGWVVGLAVLVLACVVVLALRPRWGLVAVIVLVVARGLLWSVLIPPLQGMDEGAHYANVQFMAEEGRLPNWNTEDRQHGTYSESLTVTSHAMHVSAWQPTDRPDFDDSSAEALREADAVASPLSDGTGPAASYPPAYYAPATLAYHLAADDTVAQVHAIRLWSVLLGVGAIVLAWLFAGEVLPGRPAARAGLITAVALQPMLAHQFALVNNDAWVVTAGFAALWIGARLVREARAPWWMLAAGGVAGLAALGKPFAALTVIPIAVGWLLGKLRYRVRDWRVLVGEPLVAAVGVGLTYGSWLVAARVLGINTGLGFPEGTEDGPRDLLTYARTQINTGFAEFRTLWVDQMWGNFGWVNTPLPLGAQKVVWFCYLLVALMVLVWLVLLVRGRRRGPVAEAVRRVDRLVALCVLSGLGMMLGMYAVEYGYFASTGLTNLLQGRYLLMVVPALLVLPPLLAERLVRSRRVADPSVERVDVGAEAGPGGRDAQALDAAVREADGEPVAAVVEARAHVAVTATAWAIAVGVLALHVTGVLVVAQKFYL